VHPRGARPSDFAQIRVARRLLQGASTRTTTMSKQDLPTIPPAALATASGGATREKSSSTDWQLQQTVQSITDSLSDLKNQQSSSSTSKLLPLVLMAKVMRDRNG
jgi:hypothetical protein